MRRMEIRNPATTRNNADPDPRRRLPPWAVGSLADLCRVLDIPRNRLNNAARRGAIFPVYEMAGHQYFRLVDAVEYVTSRESRGYHYARLSNVSPRQQEAQAQSA